MTNPKLLEKLEACGAIIQNTHVVLASGQHSSGYVNFKLPLTGPAFALDCGRALAEPFIHDKVDVVVGPAMGAIPLALGCALHLGHFNLQRTKCVPAERGEKGSFSIRPSFHDLISHKRILVVEDVVTSGGSVRSVLRAIRKVGGKVVGVAAICNRGVTTKHTLRVPRYEPLLQLEIPAWTAQDCPLCQQGVPINQTVGHGRRSA